MSELRNPLDYSHDKLVAEHLQHDDRLMFCGVGEHSPENHLGGCIAARDMQGDLRTWVPAIWTRLINLSTSRPRVLDVGCGFGYSTRWFADEGCDVTGVEGYSVAYAANVARPLVRYHDFTKMPFLPQRIGERYDIAWCCEFVEHVAEPFMGNYLLPLTLCSRIAMTHALPNQDGHNHVNCRPPDYWIDVFARLGYEVNTSLTSELRGMYSDGPHGQGGLVVNTLLIFDRQTPRKPRGALV